MFRQACYLGISLRTHPELLWLASAALASALPLGWDAGAPPGGSGPPFYYNPALGCAQWEHPAHCHWRGVAMFLLEEPTVTRATASSASASGHGGSAAAPQEPRDE